MADVIESQHGACRQYQVYARILEGDPGRFVFSEAFYESHDPRFDAILLLGARVDHDLDTMDVTNSWMWRGFSKKARAISRVFVRRITYGYSIPNFVNLEVEPNDYVGRNATVGTLDYGIDFTPDITTDGVLAEIHTINGYAFKTFDVDSESSQGVWTSQEFSGYRNWVHFLLTPRIYEYPWLEVTLPLSFHHRSINFTTSKKPAHVFWKLTLGVRFQGSQKANPKFTKGISVGGSLG